MHQSISLQLPRVILASPENNGADLHKFVEEVNVNIMPSAVQHKKVGVDLEAGYSIGLMYKDFDLRTQYYLASLRALDTFYEATVDEFRRMDEQLQDGPFTFIKCDLTDDVDTPELKDFTIYLMTIMVHDDEVPLVWGQIIEDKRRDKVTFVCGSNSDCLPHRLSVDDGLQITEASTRRFSYIAECASEWLFNAYDKIPEKFANQFYSAVAKNEEYQSAQHRKP